MRRRMMMQKRRIKDNEIWYYAPEQVTLSNSTDVVSHTFNDGRGIVTYKDVIKQVYNHLLIDINTITSVELPESVTSIGYQSFSGCTNLAMISLPDGLKTINNNAFYACTKLALTSLPAGVTSIGQLAFGDCPKLALTSLPAGLTSIKYQCFGGCRNLNLTSLPAGVTSIGNYAFNVCTKLALTSLPAGVTSIGQLAFNACVRIPYLDIPIITPPTLGYGAFDGTSFPLRVPASAVDTYKSAAGWSSYASRITAIPE